MCLSFLLVFHAGLSDVVRAENPTGGSFATGVGNISAVGSTLTVNTLTDRAVINWKSFNIGAGNTTNFNLPGANSAVLNRVVTPDNPSAIYGTLNSNGEVYLVNPSGILIGSTGMVNTNGFTASVLDISNREFINGGSLTFSGDSQAGVTNLGTINTGSSGATLIGGQVVNEGSISSNGGNINLIAGGTVQLSSGGSYTQADPDTLRSGISETAGLIRNSGIVRAIGAHEVGGEVYLVSRPGGSVVQEGLIAAQRSATQAVSSDDQPNLPETDLDTVGGRVVVTGSDVAITGTIDASGTHGGGTVNIGGGFQGSDPSIPNSQVTSVGSNARIAADATEIGDGGTVVLWSDGSTDFQGTISAKGAPLGTGGFVEVSGKQLLNFAGHVDTGGGNLLLDPYNYTIDDGSGDGTDEVTAILAALAGSNVTIQTSSDVAAFGSSGNAADVGNITVNSDILWSDPNFLTLLAHGDITFNASVQNDSSASGGDLNIVAGWDGTTAFDASTFLNADVTTTTLFGQGNGTVSVLNGAAVGSRNGSTNVFGYDVNVTGSGGDSQLGFRAPVTGGSYDINGAINVRTTNSVNVVSTGALAQLGHVGVGQGGSNVSADAPITVAAGGDIVVDSNQNQLSTQIGHGGKGSSGNFSGDITVLQAQDLYFNAGNGGDPSQLGHGSYASSGDIGGTIDVTISGNLTSDGESNQNRYSIVGHGGGNSSSNVTGDVFLRVGGGITLRNSHIGHLADTGTYNSGNTYIAVAQIDDTAILTSVEDSSYWSSTNGELRFYMPSANNWAAEGGSTLVNGVLGSNVYETGTAPPFKNEVGVYQPFLGGYLGDAIDNYSFYFTNPIDLLVGALSGTSTYADLPTDPGLGLGPASGSLQGSDSLSSIGLSTDFNLVASSAVGTYVISVTGSILPAYSGTYNLAGTEAGTFTINPAALTITPTNQSKLYGDAFTLDNTAFTAAGLQLGETVTTVSVTSAGTPATSDVGPYAITASGGVSGANGFDTNNYAITFNNGVLTVLPADLTITPTAQSKTYGDTITLDATSFTPTGLRNGDTVTNVALSSPGTTATVNVGAYDITATNVISGSFNPNNYNVIHGTLPGGLTVDPAALTITPTAQGKVYGVNYTLDTTAFTATGLHNGDTVLTVDLASPGTPASAPVGQYDSTATNILTSANGFDASNYVIAYETLTDGLTVGQALLTITPTNQSKLYGDAFTLDNTAFTAAGLQLGETVTTVSVTSAGTPATSDVGPYAITASGGVSGANGFDTNNYAITFNNGVLTVLPADLTITPTAQSKTYGDAITLDATSFTPTGLRNGDTVTNVALSSPGTTATVNVGAYDITATNVISGSFNPNNYNVIHGTLPGGLTVDPAALTITPTAQGKVYGVNYTLDTTAFTATGLHNGDTVLTVDLASPGTPASAPVGQYDSTATNILTSANGFDASNYVIAYETLTDGLTVGQALLTITPAYQNLTYGDELDYTAFTATGLLDGNTVNTVDLAIAGGSIPPDVGTYDVAAIAITSSGNGFADGNYVIVYNSLPGGLTVGKAELTYSVPHVFKPFQTNWVPGPESVRVDGLKTGDTFGTLPLSSPGGPKPEPFGVYPITVLGGATGGTYNPNNYNVTFLDVGQLFISPVGTSLYTYDRFTRYDDYRDSLYRLYLLDPGVANGQMPHGFTEEINERDEGDSQALVIPAMRFRSW